MQIYNSGEHAGIIIAPCTAVDAAYSHIHMDGIWPYTIVVILT